MAYLFLPTAFLDPRDVNGDLIPGATLSFYLAGTLTATPSYTTSAASVEHDWPVEADGAGKFPAIFLDPDIPVRAILKDADGVTLRDRSPIAPAVPSTYATTSYVDGLLGGRIVYVADRDALEVLATSNGVAYLGEDGREGIFEWDASDLSTEVAADTNQGLYVAPDSDDTGASGAWVREWVRTGNGPANVRWFGAVADDSTDDSGAFVAALECLYSLIMTGTQYGYGRGSPGLFIPARTKPYYLGTTTLDITHNLIIEGENGGGAAGGSTVLRWADSTTGIRVQSSTTSGGSGGAVVTGHLGASQTIIRNLMLYGGFAGTESESHGIQLRAMATVRDVAIFKFGGDGIHSNVSLGSGTHTGNTNGAQLDNIFVQECRDGMHIEQVDANAWTIINPHTSVNRRYGIWKKTTLGSTIVGGLAEANGLTAGFVAIVSIGQSWYYVLPDQEVGASTNSPPAATATITIASPGVVTWNSHGLTAGTPVRFSTTGALPTGLVAGTTYYVVSPTTNEFSVAATEGGSAINTSGSQSGTHTVSAHKNNTWWGFLNGAGGVTSVTPAWVSGMTLRAGGSLRIEGSFEQNIVLGWYYEGGQSPPLIQASAQTLFLSPMSVTPAQFDGSPYRGALTGNASGLQTPGGMRVGVEATRGLATINNAVDEWLRFVTTAGEAWHFDMAGGFLLLKTGGGASPFGVEYSTGKLISLDLGSGNVYKVNGTQVLGAQGAAVADATDAASAITQLNALLARCRAHGIIDT